MVKDPAAPHRSQARGGGQQGRTAPPASTAVVRARFRRQGRRDTVPELAVRRRLHARGVRYRVDVRPCRETRARGDLVWKRRKLVVFIDG
jgi:DNA mismatch endonuclease, patch repair protein